MRKTIVFAGGLSAAGAILIGIFYWFVVIMDPIAQGLAEMSKIRSRATRDGANRAAAEAGIGKESSEPSPLSAPHDVGQPIALLSEGKPIELTYRSLFPFVGDLNSDGREELLLGTPDAGRLKVYPIFQGDPTRVLGAPSWFDEKVPDGRIPEG